ncbi:ABC transporter ATP-binding protein [Variovorax sp. PCZ-1]|uniref:ABC transporter ATP-binding protein n=1 Tax=Variovorax sp. PCZ-1 TaxID=2835533 RepID=UPI0032DF4907
MSKLHNTPESRTAVRLSRICKRFGAVQANADVDLSIQQATIHGIVGENGAGKSTLMSILYGFYTADSGEIEVEGKSAKIKNSHEAIALGIGMVHQHFMLVDNLSALDNIVLGVETSLLLQTAQQDARTKLQALMQETGLTVNLDTLVEDLSVGDRQRLEILKALHRGARILILDEPTAVLTAQETEQLFVVLRRLRESGKTIIIITHKLKEVLALCDQVTVMRAGRVVLECATRDATVTQLAEAMVGRKLKAPPARAGHDANAPIRLSVDSIGYRDSHGVQRLSDIGFALRSGEIVGVAGVAGNGQTELLEILSGMKRPAAGSMTVLGKNYIATQWLDPIAARDMGLAHVPEDRHERGMVLQFGAWESAVLGYERLAAYCKGWFLRSSVMQKDTNDLMQRFDVRPPNPNLKSSKFSGGNQQKLILAREFNQAPKVLLVGQPTRGVDIGAIEFIHEQLRALRDAGCAILLVSTELEEILSLSDRVIVMNQGHITGELPVGECDEKNLGLLMVSTNEALTGNSA